VRVTGNVRIAEGDVHGIFGDGRSIDGKVRFFMGPLVHAESEIISPQFLAGAAIKAEG